LKELPIPDLGQIKQGKQERGTGAERFPNDRSGDSAGRPIARANKKRDGFRDTMR
jgi:hypothetical protein